MARTSFLPSTEAGLISFSGNFDTKITADPVTYGLDIAQAGAFTVLHNAFVAAWNLLQDPDTKTQPNTTTKNTAKAALIDGPGGIRQLVDIIQAFPGTTDTERTELKITVRDTVPTPAPVPDTSPILTITETVGRVVKINLQNAADLTSKAKPFGVYAANVLSFVGDTPPVELGDWKIEGTFTRTSGAVAFPATVVAGATVWITAYWVNTRGDSGPAAAMQTTNVSGALPQAA